MERKIGLALGGGGARGLAHLGVLIGLEEAGIPIHAIAGTSMGAALAASKALGMDLHRLERLLCTLNLNSMLQVSDNTLREVQRIIGRSVMEYLRGSTWKEEAASPPELARLHELFSLLTARKEFADTLVPFAVVAADIETGQRVVLREGKIGPAVTASTAVPGVFSPVAYGGRYLVDGGIVDKLPVDVAVELGADSVIAVDTGAPLTRRVETYFEAILQAQRATSKHLTQLQLERSQERLGGRLVVLRPDVGWIRMFGFEYTEEAIQAGRASVSAHLDELRELAGIPAAAPAATEPA
ncbi:MAG: patatin-like phospholipase family protein [Thermotogota bacterium]